MLKARPSFPAVIYEKSGRLEESSHGDRVTDIMARYYTRLEEIFQIEDIEQKELGSGQPTGNCHGSGEDSETITGPALLNTIAITADTAKPDIQKYINNIKNSRRKVKQISSVFNEFDDNMKKLENENQLLSTVKENLDNLGLNFWDWLREKQIEAINEPASSH